MNKKKLIIIVITIIVLIIAGVVIGFTAKSSDNEDTTAPTASGEIASDFKAQTDNYGDGGESEDKSSPSSDNDEIDDNSVTFHKDTDAVTQVRTSSSNDEKQSNHEQQTSGETTTLSAGKNEPATDKDGWVNKWY